MSEPVVKIEAKPERPTHFWISETVATLTSETGEKIVVDRAVTNPFFFRISGDVNEAEIDITDFMKSIAAQVMGSSTPHKPEGDRG